MISLLFYILLSSQTDIGPLMHFFYRPSCGHCMDILLADIPQLQKEYAFTLLKYDIDLLGNNQTLERMEEAKGTSGEDLPVIFLGDSVFYGPENIHNKLEGVLKTSAKPRKKAAITPDTTGKEVLFQLQHDIEILYFFQPGCKECNRLEALFNNLERDYPKIHVSRYSIFVDTNKIMLEAISASIAIPEEQRLLVPVIIIGRRYLIKEQITLKRIFELITEHQSSDQPMADSTIEAAEHSILERFGRFSLWGIAVAGLLDGVNPCAFATIIFFVSYLFFLGRKRKDIILMAVSFICAVFIAYFSIGVGAYNLLKYLVAYNIIGRIVFLGFGIIAIVLGILSMRDYLFARKGRLDKMLLQLPLGIKQRIHRDIKEKTATGGIVVGSFMAGLIISFLEFGCTGQIYLPTITFMISKVGWQFKPLLALGLYNIMFVVPLCIFALLAIVFTSQNVAKSLSAKIPLIKFLTALLFFALGVLLVLSA
jgi:thiol-disulfide isomerase/thioredoxin